MSLYKPKKIDIPAKRYKWSILAYSPKKGIKSACFQCITLDRNNQSTTTSHYISSLATDAALYTMEANLKELEPHFRRLVSHANEKNKGPIWIKHLFKAVERYLTRKFEPTDFSYVSSFLLVPPEHLVVDLGKNRRWTVRNFPNEQYPFWVYKNGHVQFRKPSYAEAHAIIQREVVRAAQSNKKAQDTTQILRDETAGRNDAH